MSISGRKTCAKIIAFPVNVAAVVNDVDRIRRRWRELKNVIPCADAFTFLAEIVRTGRLPKIPKKVEAA